MPPTYGMEHYEQVERQFEAVDDNVHGIVSLGIVHDKVHGIVWVSASPVA